jgi:hypothetical protein
MGALENTANLGFWIIFILGFHQLMQSYIPLIMSDYPNTDNGHDEGGGLSTGNNPSSPQGTKCLRRLFKCS